jgi:hypothetical protein
MFSFRVKDGQQVESRKTKGSREGDAKMMMMKMRAMRIRTITATTATIKVRKTTGTHKQKCTYSSEWWQKQVGAHTPGMSAALVFFKYETL